MAKIPAFIAGSGVIGTAAVLLILQLKPDRSEIFSTAALLGFLFILPLVVAAITLTLTAMSLCRLAERTLAGKAEELRLICERLETLAGKPCAEEKPAVQAPASEGIREKAVKKYGEFRDIILLGVANFPGVLLSRNSEGWQASDRSPADGIFEMKSERVAVCTFSCADLLRVLFLGPDGDRFYSLLRSFHSRLNTKEITRVFLVFDGKLNSTSPFSAALTELSTRIDAGIFTRFEIFEGSPDIVIPRLTERISLLMDAGRETPEEPLQQSA
jgi:hypothetical protein